ncbi:phosphorylase family protein [Streptomyces achromogenes]|uniref:phosphorylase family protein n=1 Tax=Streptomyces achromogenes TaxID=67255 RepID=UPI0033C7BBFC
MATGVSHGGPLRTPDAGREGVLEPLLPRQQQRQGTSPDPIRPPRCGSDPLQLEFQAVHTHLTDLESYEHETGTRVEEGALPGTPWRVALAELGEGNTNATALTERINSWLKPAAVPFVGVAGAIKGGLELGDVVVATKAYASHWLEQAARHTSRHQ